MTQWSEARPRVGDRCRFTKRYGESLKKSFPELVDMHGIVRVLPKDSGDVHIRLDGIPGELFSTRMTNVVREDHEGPDPLDETVVHVAEARLWASDDYWVVGLGVVETPPSTTIATSFASLPEGPPARESEG